MLEAASLPFLSLQSSTIYSEPRAFPNCSLSKWTIIKLHFNSKKSTKRSHTAHNKEYHYMRVLKERVQFASVAIWKAFCSYSADWWLLCLFQGTYVTEQILPGNFSIEPTQICTHAHKCVSYYRCLHAYLPSERSEHHTHTHTQSKLENLLAGVLWIPENVERNRQLCCNPQWTIC